MNDFFLFGILITFYISSTNSEFPLRAVHCVFILEIDDRIFTWSKSWQRMKKETIIFIRWSILVNSRNSSSSSSSLTWTSSSTEENRRSYLMMQSYFIRVNIPPTGLIQLKCQMTNCFLSLLALVHLNNWIYEQTTTPITLYFDFSKWKKKPINFELSVKIYWRKKNTAKNDRCHKYQ